MGLTVCGHARMFGPVATLTRKTNENSHRHCGHTRPYVTAVNLWLCLHYERDESECSCEIHAGRGHGNLPRQSRKACLGPANPLHGLLEAFGAVCSQAGEGKL